MVTAGLKFCMPEKMEYVKSFFPIRNHYFGTCAASLLLAIAGTRILNLKIDESKAIAEAIDRIGNELELLFKMSCQESQLIQITLKNDKVYIGWVELLPEPSLSPYVKLIPLLSGFRDERKELQLTTDYSIVYSEYIKRGKIQSPKELEMNLVIQVSEIISASRFDFDIFEKFLNEADERGTK